jgi:pSer/pThr/pTyr-binding forkhead associated (FHA) protein
MRIGRDPTSELRLDDPAVSSLHAELVELDALLAIRDRSSGGTFINGMRVDVAHLRPNMLIQLGTTVLRYEEAR